MRVVSYNLRKHRAAAELEEIVEHWDANVLCLQECDTEVLPETIGGLRLAESTSRNRLGLAIYHRENTFRLEEVSAVALKRSLHDRLLRPAHERLLAVRLRDIDAGGELVIGSFHAAPLTALNSLRRHQIRAALTELHRLGPGLPALMVGDYNYPVFKERLGERVRSHGFDLALSDSRTYTRYRYFRGHYDFVTSTGLSVEEVTTLPRGASDHHPILVRASYRDR